MKKTNTIDIFVVILTSVIIFMLFTSYFKYRKKPFFKYCGVSYSCRKCFSDCRRFGLEYIKYNSGGFASSSCWCMKKGSKPVRIW